MFIAGRSYELWASTLSSILVGSVLLSFSMRAQPVDVRELQVGKDLQGPVQRVAFDTSGVPWITTTQSLYKYEHGTVSAIEKIGGSVSRIVLMRGGDLYARLTTGKAGGFGVELRELRNPDRVVAALGTGSQPSGFDTLFAGPAGKVIVTAAALENLEGISGAFAYSFWTPAGNLLATKKLEGPRIGILDETGEAILLLGANDAIAFDKGGSELWRVPGNFRNGVLAGRGHVALLNPAESIEEVHVVHASTNLAITVARMPGPVHEMTSTPDGSLAAIATNLGKVTLLETNSCRDAKCSSSREMPSLPIGNTYYITSVKYIDRATVVLGVIEQTENPPNAKFGTGHVVVASVVGKVLFDQRLALPPSAAWSPLLDVTFGERIFGAYTADRVFIVEVNGP